MDLKSAPLGAVSFSVDEDGCLIAVCDGKSASLGRVRGEPGKNGESVNPDTVARMVLESVQKAISSIPPARDGRDAVEIAILPMIEEGKSYPSGVYARHAGGLVRTNGAGFDVIVNGLVGITVEQISEREFRVKAHLTDGTESAQDFKIPVMLHRGIWTERAYERGDCVTRDNSTWHCCVESTTEKPGESKHWQLIVRKGDRGRDAPGPKPAPEPVKL